MYDVVIIGAGIIGGTIFRELTKYKLKVAVLEKENDVSMGTTKANSAIVHAGFDPKHGSLAAKYNVKGSKMFEPLCKELSVPYKQNGSLVIAFDDEDIVSLKHLLKNGNDNGVPGLKILTKEETLKLEPNLSDDIKGALYAPSGAIVSPYELTIALFENACQNGGEVKLKKEVVAIENNDIFTITTKDNQIIKAKYIINAAGVFADRIHNMICKEKFTITPRIGEYFLLDKNQGKLFSHTIFQCPSKMGKGVLVTPTVHGNLIVGPSAVDTDSKTNTHTTALGLESIKKTANKTTKKINYRDNIRNFSGIRAIPSTGDFIIREDEDVKGFIDVSGMMSPGLSSAPAIAIEIINILKNSGLDLEKNNSFNPKRTQIRFMELSNNKKNELISQNPLYGRIICRCESITEGEIVDAIHRCFKTPSLDAIKRRCRPGMGRCQGGFCSPKVQEIIARECNTDIQDISLDKDGSKILFGKLK